MPRIQNGLAALDPALPTIVGARLRELRNRRKMTIRELAERAQVDKNTVLRVERGHPATDAVLERLCAALHTILPNLTIPDEEWNLPYRVHRAAEGDWKIAFNRRSRPSIHPDFTPIDDPDERTRLGRLGFVTGFQHTHRCLLRGGRLQAATIELYGPQDHPGFRHMGEEYALCLRGRVRIVFKAGEVVLEEGDAVTFWSHHRHLYESAMPEGHRGPGPQLLMVWIESEGDADAVTDPPLRPFPGEVRRPRRRTR